MLISRAVLEAKTVVATSTTESEYVATASCCGQVLWIQNQLLDYGYNFMHTAINIDNNNLLIKGFDAGRFQYLVSTLFEGRLLMSIYSQSMDERICNIKSMFSKESKTSRHFKRGRDTKIPQSSGPPVKVGDEAVHKELGDRMERATTTASSLEAE
ncbi:hypothetical protein Tco_0716020 [Tanacetum coccineum]